MRSMNHDPYSSIGRISIDRESTYRFRLEDKYKDCPTKEQLDEIAQEVLDLLATKGLKVWQVREVFGYANDLMTWREFK